MLCASELAELSSAGVPEARIYVRLKAGWSAEAAINTPVKKYRGDLTPSRVIIRRMGAMHPVAN